MNVQRWAALACFVLGLAALGWVFFRQPGTQALISATLHDATPMPVLGYARVIGYDESTGAHVNAIDLHDAPAGSAQSTTIGYLHEGDLVAVLERRPNGAVQVRTTTGLVGWTQRVFLQEQQP